MNETIILNNDPKIEFQFLDNGFELIDGQTKRNNGFYAYNEIQFSDLNRPWFPRLAKWLRIITWILNGVPYFPDAESCKKAKLIIQSHKKNLGIWLTDAYMVDHAKRIKKILDQNREFHQA